MEPKERAEAVRLVAAGVPVSAVARALDVSSQSVRTWVKTPAMLVDPVVRVEPETVLSPMEWVVHFQAFCDPLEYEVPTDVLAALVSVVPRGATPVQYTVGCSPDEARGRWVLDVKHRPGRKWVRVKDPDPGLVSVVTFGTVNVVRPFAQ